MLRRWVKKRFTGRAVAVAEERSSAGAQKSTNVEKRRYTKKKEFAESRSGVHNV